MSQMPSWYFHTTNASWSLATPPHAHQQHHQQIQQAPPQHFLPDQQSISSSSLGDDNENMLVNDTMSDLSLSPSFSSSPPPKRVATEAAVAGRTVSAGSASSAPKRPVSHHRSSAVAEKEDFSPSYGGFTNDEPMTVASPVKPTVSSASEPCFQYILMAPTSAAVRLHEESLTYLNQGQSYELKCKKLGGGCASTGSGKSFKSVIRIGFHDRRQKFQEKELLQQWRHLHHGERVLDFDLPMSYGIYNSRIGADVNAIEYVWDPSKQTSSFVKVNCISTEFTAKKHGGEKGVPFRLQVDTFQLFEGDEPPKHVHSAYAQIKVFKTKGADRKNKTDREKAEKKGDKERYQPAYDYTILTELFPLDVYEYEGSANDADVKGRHVSSNDCGGKMRSHSSSALSALSQTALPDGEVLVPHTNGVKDELSSRDGESSPALSSTDDHYVSEALALDANSSETVDWLRKNRFHNCAKHFLNFSGVDLLRLSKEDLVQICGTADGIRLHNCLQSKPIAARLTLFMCQPGAPAYHAIFLHACTIYELIAKLCQSLLQVDTTSILDVYYQGPNDVHVLVTDEVVQSFSDKSRFVVDLIKSQESDHELFRLLLKTPPSV